MEQEKLNWSNIVRTSIRIPKRVATIKICGGALTFYIDDTMQ